MLSHPGVNAGNLQQVLPVLDAIRLPRANKVLQTSLEAGDVYEFAGPDHDDLGKIAKDIESRWAWIWEVRRVAEVGVTAKFTLPRLVSFLTARSR